MKTEYRGYTIEQCNDYFTHFKSAGVPIGGSGELIVAKSMEAAKVNIDELIYKEDLATRIAQCKIRATYLPGHPRVYASDKFSEAREFSDYFKKLGFKTEKSQPFTGFKREWKIQISNQ